MVAIPNRGSWIRVRTILKVADAIIGHELELKGRTKARAVARAASVSFLSYAAPLLMQEFQEQLGAVRNNQEQRPLVSARSSRLANGRYWEPQPLALIEIGVRQKSKIWLCALCYKRTMWRLHVFGRGKMPRDNAV